MPTRSTARPVIVVTSSGMLHAWTAARGAESLPQSAGHADFRAPVPFVPQRVRARRRVVQLLVAAGVVAMVAAGLVVRAVWG